MSSFPVAALRYLRCPVCAAGLDSADNSLRCSNGHNYDVAHQGYVNLLPGGARPGTADTAEMVAAREAFLAAGHYAGLRQAVCDAAARAGVVRGETGAGPGDEKDPGCVVEVGAGTGYYLAGVMERVPGRTGLALDISKFAARRAARAHERVAAVVCDAWTALPLADNCTSLLLDVFAPRNPAEFRRVLRSDGALVVVTPSPRHLQEVIGVLGMLTVDEHKPERLERALERNFTLVEQTAYEQTLSLPPGDVAALAAMGPSAHHLVAGALAGRLEALGERIEVTVSVTVATYAPLAGPGGLS